VSYSTFSEKFTASFSAFAAWVLIVFLSVQAHAQVAGATLTGTVSDTSGAVIPGAQVSIKNVATGITRNIAADTAGFYAAPNLLPGNYEVTVSALGFATQVRTDINLEVGAQQVLNITMQVGQVTEKVQVTGEAPTVQLATSSISAVVNSTTVRELPLNGRSWTDLAALQPGVDAIQTQGAYTSGALRALRGFGAEITVDGARPQQNNYRLDGISINDHANGAPGSVLGGDLGVDAIQEFSVLTSNYSAEYGRTSGGVVNAITRSGTNQFHGGVYEFLRNSALDARNFFDGSTIPPFRRNQFGAEAGGPIRKDKMFVFGDYEGIRQSKGITYVDTVPSLAARMGNLSTGTVTVDPWAAKFLGFYPLPNGPLVGNGDRAIFTFAGQQIVTENFFTVKVDNKFSEKDSLFGTYLFDKTPFTTPDTFDDVVIGSLTKRQFAVLEESHIFSPRLLNSLRIGFHRDFDDYNQLVKDINPLAGDHTLETVPGHFAPDLGIPGLPDFLGGIGGNHGGFRFNSFQSYDDAFLTKGLHSVKFGVAFERDQDNELSAGGEFPGTFRFGSLADFLTNRPNILLAGITGGSHPGLRQSILGGYLQDDWRWRPNLTLNLGLRYETSTVPSEVQGKLSNLYALTDSQPHLGNNLFLNPTLRNFEPRVGFAWDPFRNGKTAVRGGFGVFDSLPLLYVTRYLSGQAPFERVGTARGLPPGSFPHGAFALLSPSTLSYVSVERNPPRNYVLQWNLNVQHEITPNLTAMIGYVGSHGVHQTADVDDGDIVLPTRTSAGYLFPNPIGNGTKINPGVGTIRYINWGGNSLFHGLELAISKKMSRGLQAQGAYSWGKSIDTGSASIGGDTFTNGLASLPWYDTKSIRGLSEYNVGRTLVISGTWEVPYPKSFSGPAAWITKGWQMGGIFKASDGVPFTATFGTDGDPQGLNSSDVWAFPNRLNGPGCNALVNPGNPNHYIRDGALPGQASCFTVPSAPSMPFWTANCDPMPPGTTGVPFPQCFNLRGNSGRNILIGPGTSNLDFSVFKNNYVKRVSENFNVQFRAELFNILNHANFAVPVTPNNTDIFDSTGAPTGAAGLLTSTTTTAREIQFALKVIW
jgi:hypothetical protein